MVYWLHFVKDPKRSMLHFSKSNSHTNAEVGEFFAKFKAENRYGTPLPSSKGTLTNSMSLSPVTTTKDTEKAKGLTLVRNKD